MFAIISRPESNISERQKVVERFLQKQLNNELAQEYLQIFNEYYGLYQEKYRDKNKYQKSTSSSSVKLLVICVQINRELTQKQKFTLMVLLLTFIKSGHEALTTISEFEQEFVETVAEAFSFNREEFQELLHFVILPVEFIPDSPNLLLISGSEINRPKTKLLRRDGISDGLAVLHVQSVNMYICRYVGKTEVYLNSQAINPDLVYVLNYGSSIRNSQITPIYYSDIVNCFYLETQSSPMLFEARGVEYRFAGGNTGLHPVNFEIFSGNIVGIMGGSGAGKSTLLNVLTGLYQPSRGEVLLNGVNIHKQQSIAEGFIGYVSQDDLLIEELTVFQNLYYNAKLCFGQYSDEEIRIMTGDILRGLGLYEVRHLKVGSPLDKKISGGQRKRLNIGFELIRRPAVLFLDEPTSGLSSSDSDNIMVLLKELSLKGNLVFVVIHQPSSDIFKMFDRLLVLDQGGYLIYNGNPVESVLYFKSQIKRANRDTSECPACGNVNPEQIFNIVEARVLDEHGQATNTRRISPRQWYAAFKAVSPKHVPEEEKPGEFPDSGQTKRPSRMRQFFVYATRNVLTKLSDMQYIIVSLLEAPLLALLLSYVIRYYNVSEGRYTFELNENVPIYIFIAVIIAIFIGLSISAEEIIRDRKILKREAFLHLSRGSYLFSKTLVLFVISAIQAILFILAGNSVIEIANMTFVYWLVLFTSWAAANLLGLIISDTFKSVVTIYILIPFIVIPQLMLSGVLLRFEKINPAISSPASVPWYGEMITARWAFEALAVEQFMNNGYERIMYPYEKSMSVADFKKNYWLVEMKNKFSEAVFDFSSGEKPKQETLALLSNEIDRENKRQSTVNHPFRERLDAEGFSEQLIDETNSYFEQLTRYYTVLYNKSVKSKDRMTEEIAAINSDSLHMLRSKYYSQNLGDMVKNSGEMYRLIEYKGRLLQNYHQIYKDSDYPFIKAHFYAPVKNVFGWSFPTLWVNVAVMWLINIFLFAALYFRWLPDLLGFLQKRKE
ncbi:MAG: ATP-binding cassette domain-containing protein [Prevotellaceae bacterium]|nr:ATP-binding cassette domain-containing protein [Prevotellaceae bacterium]